MNRQDAIASGLPRYAGKACQKHPDLRGERYVANWGCVACAREATQRNYETPQGFARAAAHAKAYACKSVRREARAAYKRSERGRSVALAYSRRADVKARRLKRGLLPDRVAWKRAYKQLPKERARRAFDRRVREQRVAQLATPVWASKAAIASVYEKARWITEQTGLRHVVDHFIPLKGKTVCGLHVEGNLRVIPEQMNLLKGNRLFA